MSKRYSIVGTSFTGTPENFIASLTDGQPIRLVREPSNPADPLAIAVYAGAMKIGYIPRKQNAGLAELIDGRDQMALDESDRGIPAKFVRSRSSGFPMVEVPE